MRFSLTLLFILTLLGISIQAQQSVDVTFQRLLLNVNPDSVGIKGNTTIFFSPKLALQALLVDLKNDLTVDSVLYHSNNQSFTHVNHKIEIPFTQIIQAFSNDSISIFYSGEPPHVNSESAFHRDVHQGIPVVFTLSEPYGSSEWWPCMDNLTDKIDSIDIVVTTPERYCVASNGLLIQDSVINGWRTNFWKHRYPISPYLVGIAITNYLIRTDTAFWHGDTIPVVNYIFPEDSAMYLDAPYVTPLSISYYSDLFGRYPFAREKYGHAMITGNGGMENQTITFLSNFSFMLVLHELAHQWFGDFVTCANWHDIWLNEGFATFFSYMSLDWMPSPNGFDDFRKSVVNDIIQEPNGAVWVEDTTSVPRIFSNRLSYEKGAMVLNILRTFMGKTEFLTAINNYLNDSIHKYGFAQTATFMSHLRAVSSLIPNSFEDEWIYGEGFPNIVMNANVASNNVLTMAIQQMPTDLSVSKFTFPLSLKIMNGQHDSTITVLIKDSTTLISIRLPFCPDSVIVNPHYQMITPRINIPVSRSVEDSFVYPNPTSGLFSIYNQNKKITQLQLFDIKGQQIPIDLDNQNITNLPEGVYFLKIVVGTNRADVVKIVKVRK
jgi:aminopeptidase N